MARDVGMAFGLMFLLLFAYLLIGICIFAYATIPEPFNIIFLGSLFFLVGYKFVLSMRKEKQRQIDSLFYEEQERMRKKVERESREKYWAEKNQKREEERIARKAKEKALKKAMLENPDDDVARHKYYEYLNRGSMDDCEYSYCDEIKESIYY